VRYPARSRCPAAARQQQLFKTNVHHLCVARALKHQWRDQPSLLRSGDDAGAFPPFPGHCLVNPLAPGRAAILTIEAVIHAAFVQVKEGLTRQFFQFAPEEPPLHLVALAIFCEFFLT